MRNDTRLILIVFMVIVIGRAGTRSRIDPNGPPSRRPCDQGRPKRPDRPAYRSLWKTSAEGKGKGLAGLI